MGSDVIVATRELSTITIDGNNWNQNFYLVDNLLATDWNHVEV